MTDLGAFSTIPETATWPALPYEDWCDTYATLHLWLQVVGKIRLVQSPWLNHSWHASYYVTSRGLTTSPIPHGSATFQIDFDFIDHSLSIQTSRGDFKTLRLSPRSVSDFYHELMEKLAELGIHVDINTTPNEMADAIPFEKDREHASYDAAYASRHWRVLVQADRVFKEFRARFIGKSSPVHFFWGSFDLALTRFSGRKAPEHPGGIPHLPDWVTREAYSHELSSAGFWPGGGPVPYPAFYAYAYPEPKGYSTFHVRPSYAFYSAELREFILPYETVRLAESPDRALLEFLQTTYAAAADLGGWDRAALEWEPPSRERASSV